MTLFVLAACSSALDGRDDTASDELIRSNVPPAVVHLAITPDPAYAADTLVPDFDVIDVDEDPIEVHFLWEVDGESIEGADAELTAFTAVRDEEVALTIYLSDGWSFGQPETVTLTMSNTSPVSDSIDLSPTSATIESNFVCELGASDDDGDELTELYRYVINGVAGDEGERSTLTEGFVRDDEVVCEARAEDPAGGLSDWITSGSVVIDNSPPLAPGIGVDPDPPIPCQDATASVTEASYDADGDTLSYDFVWTDADGAVVVEGTDVAADTLVEGETYVLTVTPHDGIETGTPATLEVTPFAIGESMGNELDDDCDGVVDEWLDQAWHADQVLWGDAENGQLGIALAVGDFDGGGAADLAVSLGGESELWVLDELDPEHPRIDAEPLIFSDASSVGQLAAGDATGDGVADLLVGASGFDGDAGTNSGAVFLLGGTLGGYDLSDIAIWRVEGEEDDQDLGLGLAIGDVDGDGIGDIAVGDPYADAPNRDAGRVWVFSGGGAGVVSLDDADFVFDGQNREVHFGSGISVVPDIDGDGHDELAIGGPEDDGNRSDGGTVGIWWGGSLESASLDDVPLEILGADTSDGAGREAVAGGDVDGDGLGDVVVGSQGEVDGLVAPGTLSILLGSDLAAGGAFLTSDAHAVVHHDRQNAWLGLYGGGPSLGDIDGDGLADLAAGAPGVGGVYLWRSEDLAAGGTFTPADAPVALAPEDEDDQLGRWVAMGDTDGNGVLDLVTSAYRSSMQEDLGGAVYVFRPEWGAELDIWEPACDRVGDRIFCRTPETWSEARRACQAYGGDLVRIDDSTANDEVGEGAAARSVVGHDRGRWWIGLSDTATDGTWAWLDDTSETSFTSWQSGRPGDDACAFTNGAAEGVWTDEDCSTELFFACDVP